MLASQDQSGGDATVTIDQRKCFIVKSGIRKIYLQWSWKCYSQHLFYNKWEIKTLAVVLITDNLFISILSSVSPAVQIIPAQVSTPTAIKVLKQSRGPRTPRISGGEERSSPGNRTGSTHSTQGFCMYTVYLLLQMRCSGSLKELKIIWDGGFGQQISKPTIWKYCFA